MKRSGPLRRTTRLRTRSATPATHREVLSADEDTQARSRIAAAQGFRCRNPACRTAKGPFDFDHVTPRSQGGSDRQRIMLCRRCHDAKGDGRLVIRPVIVNDRQDYAFEDTRPNPHAGW